MRHPQVLIYESDGRLAEMLRSENKPREWSIREPRSLEAGLRLLRRGGPSVAVLKLGKDLLRELTLLERVTWLFPETAVIVVGDTENSVLAGLAWDLGASFVLSPPLARGELFGIVTSLINSPARQPRASSKQTT